MNNIVDYIQERIAELQVAYKMNPVPFWEWAIAELQAVLTKIEELEKEEIADARGENFFNDRN